MLNNNYSQVMLAGKYQLLEQIGRGGMADVYRAYMPSEDRHVAVKILSLVLTKDSTLGRRFEREARVVADLTHPNIIPVEDYGKEGDYAYLVMPYMNVGTLADRLLKSRISLKEGARILDQIASALDYAHEKGVIHRDVKPSNILLDSEGNAYLTDFGVARIHDASVSLTGSALLGTPAYMSPEQAAGNLVTDKSDQYSLGVILYQMATGQLPFDAETPMAVLMKHMHEPLPSPRSVSPKVPEIIERVILKATAKRPQDRFESIAEMNDTFQKALGHVINPAAVPPPEFKLVSPYAETRKLDLEEPVEAVSGFRRYRLVFIGALLLLAVGLSSALLVFNQMRDENTASSDVDPGILYEQTIEVMSMALLESGGTPIPTDIIRTMIANTLDAQNTLLAGEGLSRSGTQTKTPLLGTLTITATGSLSPSGPILGTKTSPPTSTLTVNSPPKASETPRPTSTFTSTWTYTPTLTPTETPSPTPEPTPTPNVCLAVTLGNFGIDDKAVQFVARNNNPVGVFLTALGVDWPQLNESLVRVDAGGQTVWTGNIPDPPAAINLASNPPQIPAGGVVPFTLHFSDTAAPSGYRVTLWLNGVCSVVGYK